MRQDLFETLQLRYPAVFGNTYRAECGDGWFGILDALGEQLTRQAELERRPATAIRMFKEKFGTLRFARTAETESDAAFCEMAISMSSRICEICGNSGESLGAMVRCRLHVGL